MTLTSAEIDSQPDTWERALALGSEHAAALTRPGQRVLILGCGTSAFVAQAVATLREAARLGTTDWAYASEPWPSRDYDAVIFITRSGTTTEILDAMADLAPGIRRVVVTAVADSPAAAAADEVVALEFADERSVVQTRFPTTFLALARRAFGEDLSGLARDARPVLAAPLALDVMAFDHFVFLGRGWTYGLAQEAALKIREAAQAWSESYPALDYRHGPIAVAGRRSLVWMLGVPDDSLARAIQDTGATVLGGVHDPLIELALAQRLAVEVARTRGLDPDAPRHLTRSVILD